MSATEVKPGIPFVVAAPSGTGKTTVCHKVVECDPGIVLSVSHTTRPRRGGEVDGEHYHFVDGQEFQRLIAEGAFLEWAKYNDNHYGTSWKSIETPIAEGRDVLLEIEVQGARQVRDRRSDARMIFLLPPSMRALEKRLRGRGTDGAEQVRQRLKVAEQELEEILGFDYAVENDDLDRCVEEVLEIVRSERTRCVAELRERFSPARADRRFKQRSR